MLNNLEQNSPIRGEVPIVSFDVKLGERFKSVDFDYDKYFGLTNALGLSNDEAATVTIRVGGLKKRSVNGVYDPSCNEILIKPRSEINSTFVHEMQHASDNLNSRLGSVTRRIIGNLAISASIPVNVLMWGAQAYEELNEGEKIATFLSAASTVSAFVNMALIAACYYLHPDEIRARKAAREIYSSVLTLES